jgi:hypothetical protein
MKKFIAVFLLLLSFCFVNTARAAQLLGGDIEYQCVAPGVYVVAFFGYYDCSGAAYPATVQLNISAPGCNAGRLFSINAMSPGIRFYNPYCTSTGNACGSTALPNVQAVLYSTTITLNNAQCTDWVLSFRDCSRAPVANIPNTGNSCLYIESSMHQVNYSMDSPELTPISTFFASLNEPATISTLARDRWGSDSLVYSLKPALDTFNAPVSYAAGYSFSNPLPSSTGVQVHPLTGMLTFTPNSYNAATTPGANAYAIVVEITSYRKINGVVTKVSTMQRNLTIFVLNNSNKNPQIINATANGQPILPNTILPVAYGSTLTLQFGTADANSGDSVTIVNPNRPGLGPMFTVSGGSRPTGLVSFTATSVSGEIVYIPVVVRDNACPLRGITTHIYGFKVVGNPLGLKKQMASAANFTAYPNPFTDEIHFKFDLPAKAESIEIYNLLGQQVDRIALENAGIGEQQIAWANAQKFKPGTYVARLIAKDKTVQTLKFTRL